jgi:hypothetical protein
VRERERGERGREREGREGGAIERAIEEKRER